MFAFIASGAGGANPTAPTIGTATAGDQSATVAFTPSSYLGKGGTVTYTATSSPGGFTGTSTTSPIRNFGKLYFYGSCYDFLWNKFGCFSRK
jgi:hypothetical protein